MLIARMINSAALTDALGADLAVTFGALAGEGTDRVDALLAGLTVVLVALAFVHVCVGGARRGDAGVRMGRAKPHYDLSGSTRRCGVTVGGGGEGEEGRLKTAENIPFC